MTRFASRARSRCENRRRGLGRLGETRPLRLPVMANATTRLIRVSGSPRRRPRSCGQIGVGEPKPLRSGMHPAHPGAELSLRTFGRERLVSCRGPSMGVVTTTPRTLWTIGHSNHGAEQFAALLDTPGIEYLVDIRSYPYSRFAPQFNREALKPWLESRGMRYVFMGEDLGGRPDRDDLYDAEGHALYGLMAREPRFQHGINRLVRGSEHHRLAIMCSCGQPDDCHRRLLVGKVAVESGLELRHILPDGSVIAERTVPLPSSTAQGSLLETRDEQLWRSTRSVSHRRRLSVSSNG